MENYNWYPPTKCSSCGGKVGNAVFNKKENMNYYYCENCGASYFNVEDYN